MSTEQDRPLTVGELTEIRIDLARKEKEIEEKAQQLRRLQQDTTGAQGMSPTLQDLEDRLNNLSLIASRIDRLEESFAVGHQRARRDSSSSAEVNHLNINSRDALNLIPEYDGSNMSVFQFTEKLEQVRVMFPREAETNLIHMIVNKLKGLAAKAVAGIRFVDFDGLTSVLKQVFAPQKLVSDYYGELANLCKKPNEHVVDYIARTRDIIDAIEDGERTERGVLPAIERKRIESRAISHFLSGLPSDLQLHVKHETYRDLAEIFLKTIAIEKALAREKQKKQNMLSQLDTRRDTKRPPNAPAPKENRSKEPTSSETPKETCRYCKKPGHNISQCRTLAYKKSQQGNYNGAPRNGDASRSAPSTSRPTMTIQATTKTPQ